MKALLIIDHGSKLDQANQMLDCMANLIQAMAGDSVVVRFAHMELADPSIGDGFAACVAAGATEVIAFPYMLSPGRHSTGDIPRMVAEAAERFPGVRYQVTAAFGVHEKLAELILARAGLEPRHPMTAREACRCWHSSGSGTACGEACRARPETMSTPAPAAAARS